MVPFTPSQSCHHQVYKKHWNCHQCGKRLSSKRSYEEHMNIHNKSRPFACDECNYAAASQMTLRRHKLRNHVSRTDWGYQCPYCEEKYMEPASYQQHVIARHWGYSATFGCPYGSCTFSTKSSRYFTDHMAKHQAVVANRSSFVAHSQFNVDNLALYLINDECGAGHSSGKTLRRYNTQFDRHKLQPKTVQRIVYRDAIRIVEEKEHRIARINVDKLLDDEERQENKGKIMFRPAFELERICTPSQRTKTIVVESSHLQKQPEEVNNVHIIDWIETEVVIDDEAKFSQLSDGQTDDFGLD